MSQQIECFFDVGSPASYLAWTQLPAIAARHSGQVIWKPMLLGAVFQATGNHSPVTIEAKRQYLLEDLQRFAHHYEVPFTLNPFFPINTLLLMRGAVAYQDTPHFQDYLTAIFTAIWVDEQDMRQPEVISTVLAKAGFEPEQVLERCSSPKIKERLRQVTDEAVQRGVFGAPTMFVGDEMFFGQDRLMFVEEALAATT
ncbi:2-hydroxychromene-2-carboxylate isomerase [Halomonas cupida]|nr:2-hydroxychromene-2-carboxylate isomerase [Halomonas cupida]